MEEVDCVNMCIWYTVKFSIEVTTGTQLAVLCVERCP